DEGRQAESRHLRPPRRDIHHPEDHGQRICRAGQKEDGIRAQGIAAMTENIFTTHTEPQTSPAGDPTLRRNLELPKGVLQKNLKIFVYLGAALLVIVAALFSSSGKKTPAQQAGTKGQPPQPTLQDNTDSNVQELKNQIQAERQKERQATMAAAALGDPALASATPAQRTAAAAYGPNGVAAPCVPGQPCSQLQQGTEVQLTPVQQQAQLIAAKE